MGNKTVTGGIASEYDDQILWIENPEVGASAAKIVDDSEYTPCVVSKIIARSDYDSEDDYSAACDEIIGESEAECTGEFVTIEEIYYVELENAGDTESFDVIDYEDVEFC